MASIKRAADTSWWAKSAVIDDVVEEAEMSSFCGSLDGKQRRDILKKLAVLVRH